MPIIALSGIRGGAGTTSITAALAWALCQAGESVLAVDLSPDNLLRLHFNMPFKHARGWARAEIDGEGWHQGAMEYLERLAFLPFGRTTPAERLALFEPPAPGRESWGDRLCRLRDGKRYRWILLDMPGADTPLAQQCLPVADHVLMVINPDANCHARLHQQALPAGCRLLVNGYLPTSGLQHDINQLWLQALDGLLPVIIHRDESVAEALAAKQPLGEYRPDSNAAEEIVTLANWCLIHCPESAA
ncbi:cellulose synthase operon protein YhjQ [Sodalis ligni]|uniref:cellulose biosynthesis protein BcsQ n=1 Tax=Sodalis ligni TaxID=2697027 RepID=UPI00193F80FB|nr:cellulose biosynthesis protein BcsQ [Sodalis ligni]QWA09257.1 cellulose synthase operon protein YhjQ [Sodalis ligni]